MTRFPKIAAQALAVPDALQGILPTTEVQAPRRGTDEAVVNTLGTAGAIAAAPAAGAWYGAQRGLKELPRYRVVQPGVTEAATRFTQLANNAGMPADDFVKRYIQHGSALTGQDALRLPNGQTLTGAEAIKAIRGGELTGPLVDAVSQRPYDVKSEKHYKAFAKGPVASYAQMAQEVYDNPVTTQRIGGGEHTFGGKRGLTRDFVTTIGEARYEAARELAEAGKLHPTRFRKRFAEVLERKLPDMAQGDVRRLARTVEQQMLEAAPKEYMAHLDTVRRGQDATQLQNTLMERARLAGGERTNANVVMSKLRRLAKQQRQAGPVSRLSSEAQQKLFQQLVHSDDPLIQLANMRIRKGWSDAPRQYGRLIDPLIKYEQGHQKLTRALQKVRKGGRWAALIGGGAALSPILYSLIANKDQPVKTGAERPMRDAQRAHTYDVAQARANPLRHAYKLGADSAYEDFMKQARSETPQNLGDTEALYKRGAATAWERLGLKKEKSTLEKVLPWATGLGAGALTFGLLRRFRPAAAGNPLRALQNLAKNKKFSIATEPGSKTTQRLRSLIFGAPTVNKGRDVGGTVLHHTPSPTPGMGDVNIGQGSLANAMHDKYMFDRVMREGVGAGPGMAGALPDTELLRNALKRAGGNPDRLKELFPEGFFIKAREGSMGRGIFTSLEDKGVREALQNPERFIIQRRMPIEQEFRVHTLEGQPFASTHRWLPHKGLRRAWDRVMGGGGGAFVPATGKTRRELEEFVRNATAHLRTQGGKPLAEVGEATHAAYDVAKLRGGGYKLIEANPVPGTLMNPVIAQKLQRQVTGRWSRPVAALGAAGVAAPVIGATS